MNSWRQYKLDELYSFSSGISKPASFFGYGYPFLSFRVVFNNYFLPDTFPDLVDSSEKERHSCSIKRGDVFLTRTSETDDELGMSSVALKDYENATFNGFTKRLRPLNDKIILPEFIGYYFRWSKFRANIVSMASVTTRASLNNSMLGTLCIALPSFPEQRAIASVLSSLDAKIDLLHRQNTTLEAMAEALFKKWFVVEAKEEWEICHLGDILDTIESGSRPKGGIDPNLQIGIASIGAESIDGIGKYDFSKTKFVTQEFYDQMKRGKIRDYDVLIYKDGAYIGKKGMFALGYPFTECAINEHVFILRANKKARQSFLYFLLQKDEIEALNSNAAQPGINQDALKSLEIILPSKNDIGKFDTIVLPWINKIFVNALQIRTLEKLRDSLLPKLMSGEVRVKY